MIVVPVKEGENIEKALKKGTSRCVTGKETISVNILSGCVSVPFC